MAAMAGTLPHPDDTSLERFLGDVRQRIQHTLNDTLTRQHSPYGDAQEPRLARLFQALDYSVSNGGKRLRPALVYAAARAINPELTAQQWQDLDTIALAIECIHSYSLVHDDLPAMDDDDLRRGKPTCHIAYDEATAILVGDGLQALAFELVTECHMPALTQVAMVRLLAQAAGNCGMVGGQALDLASENQAISVAQLEQLHRLKTGAMIRASVAAGAMIAQADDAQLASLDTYANAIGLAFQVHDDVLDISSDTQTLGKPQGADLRHNKATYPALLGFEPAVEKAHYLIAQAHQALANVQGDAAMLTLIADFVVQRKY